MATGNVIMIDADNNIGSASVSENSERVSGLLFDISKQIGFWTTGVGKDLAGKLKDTVVELHNLQEAKDLGILPWDGGGTESKALLNGIPYYHIEHFFTLTNNVEKTLFIAFADCAINWNAIIDMQKAANGQIGQFGVWTEQELWKQTSSATEGYSLNIVPSLQAVANELASTYNAPASIILNANSAKVSGTTDNKVNLNKIPSTYVDARYVTVALGQESTLETHAIQASLASCTPVGNVGLALGLLNRSNVAHSIGYVNDCNLRNVISTNVEFGFGDANVTTEAMEIADPTPYDSLTMPQLDAIDDKGYIFLHKYAGYAGVFFSKDYSCSDKDYSSISRNRVINKCRRMVRRALLPYVNAPIYLSSGGTLSTGDRTNFINIITDVLKTMKTSGEISDIGQVNFDTTTNLLQTKTLIFSFGVLPVGCAETIRVTEGFTVTV